MVNDKQNALMML